MKALGVSEGGEGCCVVNEHSHIAFVCAIGRLHHSLIRTHDSMLLELSSNSNVRTMNESINNKGSDVEDMGV